MKNINKKKRKISKKFIVYVIITLIIVYIFIFTLGTVYKVDMVFLLILSIPIAVIWVIYSILTLKPYIYEEEKIKCKQEDKHE